MRALNGQFLHFADIFRSFTVRFVLQTSRHQEVDIMLALRRRKRTEKVESAPVWRNQYNIVVALTRPEAAWPAAAARGIARRQHRFTLLLKLTRYLPIRRSFTHC